MSKVHSLSRWKKHPQPEREEYSDDEDLNDPFEETDVEGMIEMPSKRKTEAWNKLFKKERKAASENIERN